jgi:hypothetical protein
MASALSKGNRRFGRVVVLALTFMAIWIMTAYTLPFRPFILRDYDAIPPQGCPGDPLQLTVHYDLVEPPYLNAHHYRIRTNWVERETGADTPLDIYEGDFSGFERGRSLRIVSPHYRVAPPLPGSWQVYTDMIIWGRVLGIPRQQILPGRIYDNIFRALPVDTDPCRR